ncbi:hypothetical protein CLOSTHATH_00235 [Hungatella hathewayi DSM 13479]|uniref:Uncharacterized protein n=1 Tax=Hungatella hathewayi DSM 13479 TaxID=566550 RepID=D3A9G4_9FIRM|nr:hypothetical protein CLOSTHATH_00235 [Hungatella hathewayi DSM 13479]
MVLRKKSGLQHLCTGRRESNCTGRRTGSGIRIKGFRRGNCC